jgi:hypothetical protein
MHEATLGGLDAGERAFREQLDELQHRGGTEPIGLRPAAFAPLAVQPRSLAAPDSDLNQILRRNVW